MARGDITVAVPLTGGLDTKTNAQVVLPTKMLRLENADFTKGGSSRSRFGYRNVPCRDVDGVAIEDAHAVAPLNDGFVLLGRTNAYMLDRGKNAWSSLGAYTPLSHEEKQVAYCGAKQSAPDMDTVNGVSAVAWEDSRGGIRCTIYDEASGAAFVSEYELVSANATRPRVVAVGANLLITWYSSATTSIVARVIKTNDVDGTVGSANVTLFADANASGQHDIVSDGSSAYLAVHQDVAVADRIRLLKVNSFGTVTISVTVGAKVPGVGPAVTWHPDNNSVFVAFEESGGDVWLYRYQGSDLVLLHEEDAGAPAAGLFAVTASCRAEGGVSLWYQSRASGASTASIIVANYRLSDFLITGGFELRHAELASCGFYDGFNSYCLVRYNDSNLTNIQNTFYVYRDDGVLVGRMLPGSADGTTAKLTRVKTLGDNQFEVALPFKRQVQVNLDKITGATKKQTPQFEHQGVQRCLINTAASVSAAQVDGVLYASGGFLWSIDGAGAPVEAQFLQFPDQIAASMATVAGGSLTANSAYGYRVYYEWTNARGQRVRSLALDLTVSTTANQTIRFTLQTLTHTRTQSRSPISIVVYRTMANQTVFYHRVSSSDPTVAGANGYIANITTGDTITWDDTMSDANAEQKEIDYRSEGETDHFAFDAPAVIATVGNRVFAGGGGEFPNRPQFSLLRRDGRPVETNDTWVVSEFPEHGGRLTGFSDINGVPVVFKERAIYAVKGSGPTNNRGAANDYQAQAVATDVGCTEPRSVVGLADGVFFKSAKGIHLLGTDFSVSYVGAEVEAYNSQEITGAEVIPDTNQVVFLTSEGLALVYDYFYKSWSAYANHEGGSSAVTEADYAYLRNDGELYIRETGTYTDADLPYEYVARTAPLRLEDAVQGFHRLTSFQVLGTYYSPHTLTVSVYYNRDKTPYQTFSFDPGQTLDLDPWGGDEPWGDDSVWGGDWMAEDYDFECKPKRQKHSTVSFEFRGIPGVSPGAGFELTELLLTIRPRGGHFRLPASRKL